MVAPRNVLRGIVSFAVGGIAGVVAAYVAGEAFVHWYMRTYGIVARTELGEDLGFGIAGLGVSVGAFIAAFLLSAVAVWIVVGRGLRRRADV
jgi:hypothetical protein